MRVTRRNRTSALVAAAALLMTTAGCSDDSSGSGGADDASSSSDPDDPDDFDCALSSAALGAITGFDFTGVEPTGGSEGSLVWDGCAYETDGDAGVELSVIVDENGEPDVASYDAFEADAREAGETDPAGDTEIGGGSFFDADGGLYVRSVDSTLHFSLSNSDDGDPPPEDLEAIALGVLDASGPESDCESLPAQVPAGYSAQDDVSTGTSSVDTLDFLTCRFAVSIGGSDGATWDLEIGYNADPEVFDLLVADTDQSGGNDQVKVDDVGDSAVRHLTSLYFKVGDTAYAVEGEDDAGEPLSFEVLEEIAQAVVEDAGDPGSTGATSETTEPTDEDSTEAATQSPGSEDFCTNLSAMIESVDGLLTDAFESDDYPAYVAWAQSFITLGGAVVETAPADQAADAATAIGPLLSLAEKVAVLDPTDKKAIDRAFNKAFTANTPGVDAAGERILEHCGIDPSAIDE